MDTNSETQAIEALNHKIKSVSDLLMPLLATPLKNQLDGPDPLHDAQLCALLAFSLTTLHSGAFESFFVIVASFSVVAIIIVVVLSLQPLSNCKQFPLPITASANFMYQTNILLFPLLFSLSSAFVQDRAALYLSRVQRATGQTDRLFFIPCRCCFSCWFTVFFPFELL